MQAEYQKSFCSSCEAFVDETHWFWMKDSRYRLGGKWRCKQRRNASGARYRARVNKDPIRKSSSLAYQREYAAKHPELSKYKSMLYSDKKAGRVSDITLDEYRMLINMPCYYCGVRGTLGLDRIDNALGHTKANCRTCCEKCNIILGDIPEAAKHCLIDGLTKIAKQGLLETWIIPQKRGLR